MGMNALSRLGSSLIFRRLQVFSGVLIGVLSSVSSHGITTSSSNSSLRPSANMKRMPNIAYIYSWVTRKTFNVTLRHTTEIFPFQNLQLLAMERGSPKAAYELYRSSAGCQGYAPCGLQGLSMFRGLVRALFACFYSSIYLQTHM
jgi:hypothetical protein